MKKILFILLFFSALNPAFSQDRQYMPNAIQFSAGPSSHGTGDLQGASIDVSYDHGFSKRLDLTNGLTTTIHSGKDVGPTITISLPNQPTQTFEAPEDSYLRYTTAGVQLTSVLNYNFIALPKFKLRIGGGTVVRYESSSKPTVWGYTYSPIDNELPVYTFNDYGNLHQFSVGFNLGLSTLFQVAPRSQMGIKAYFQNDTNGSTITHLSFVLGRYL